MKKLFLAFSILATISSGPRIQPTVEAKIIQLNIEDDDIKIVEHDVIDAEEWLLAAWKGKVSKCRERLIKKEVEESVQSQEPLPAGEDAILEKALKRPGYESRRQREDRFKREKEAEERALRRQQNQPQH